MTMTERRGIKIIAVSALTCFMWICGSEHANAEWSIETVDSSVQVEFSNSISLDNNNYPHISYYDYTNKNLKYVKMTGAGWSTPETVDSAGSVGSYTSLALDSNNYPHISYHDATNGDLKYVKWTGAGWSTLETVDSAGSVGSHTSLALDSNNYPHISYYDSTNYNLKYARWTGSSWLTETVDSEGHVGYYSSLALDSNNYPHISYEDDTNHNLKYARWTGSSWLTETVDSLGYVGHSSLALDSNDYPHISYNSSYPNYNLKYARWTGSSWLTETVDSLGYVGYYSSLALDSNNYPHISYSGWLKYVKMTGAGWSTPETIVNTGYAYYSSLALDNNDYPHISYLDGINDDLKYAKWVEAGNSATIVSNISTLGTSGDIAVTYTLTDAESDTCSVTVQYQGGSKGTTWTNATIKDADEGTIAGNVISGLSSSSTGINHSFKWASATDEPNQNHSDYKIQIKPNDGTQDGNWVPSGTFSVDNTIPNTPPTVTVTTPTTTQTGNVLISYTLSDPESDTCSISVNFSQDGGATWSTQQATQGTGGDGTTGLTSSLLGTPHTYAWNSLTDIGNTDQSDIRIRITPSDTKTGTAGTTGNFRVNNTSAINTSPIAYFTVMPSTGTIDTIFQFDASGSTDVEDSTSVLQVRWDWENDGTWDTSYITLKTATHQYSTAGTKTIKLEVKDTGNLTNTTTRSFEVTGPTTYSVENIGVDGNENDVYVSYILKGPESDTCSVTVEYQGGAAGTSTWRPAAIRKTDEGDEGTIGNVVNNIIDIKTMNVINGLSASPEGVSHIFLWISDANEFMSQTSDFKIRLTPSESENIGSSMESEAFALDNTGYKWGVVLRFDELLNYGKYTSNNLSNFLRDFETRFGNLKKELGVRYVKFWLPWRMVECYIPNTEILTREVADEKIDDYANAEDMFTRVNWADFDTVIVNLLSRGLVPVPLIGDASMAPLLSDLCPTDKESSSKFDPETTSEDNYKAHLYIHAAGAAKRYASLVPLWNLENELNWMYIHFYIIKSRSDAWLDRNFCKEVLETLNDAVKKGNPYTKTTMNINVFDPGWWLDLTDWSNNMDIIGLGAYPNYLSATPVLGQFLIPNIQRAKLSLFGKPIMVMETGYPSGPSDSSYTNELQKQYIEEATSASLLNGTSGFFYLDLSDPYERRATGLEVVEDYWGLTYWDLTESGLVLKHKDLAFNAYSSIIANPSLVETIPRVTENLIYSVASTFITGPTATYEAVVNAGRSFVEWILDWTGSTLRLEIYKPDSTLYGQWESDSPPITVQIPNPASGTWQARVMAVDIPTEDYPFVLAVQTNKDHSPQVFAGEDSTITATGNTDEVKLEGVIGDPDGDVVSYEWLEGETTLATGQGDTSTGAVIVSYDAVLPIGTHNIQLKADDGENPSVTDEVTITITGTVTEVVRGATGGGCFIATAAYGTEMAEEVKWLCRFRDEYMLTNNLSRGLVSAYYRYGPRWAEKVAGNERLKAVVRAGLKPLVWVSKCLIREEKEHKD